MTTGYLAYEARSYPRRGMSPITFGKVLAIMDTYRPKPEIPLNGAQFTETSREWTSDAKVYVHEGRFLLDLTYASWITIAVQQEGKLSSIPTCQHSRNPQSLLDQCNNILRNIPKPWEPVDVSKPSSDVYRCCFCPTEYRFMVLAVSENQRKLCKGARHRVVLQRCVDFGEAKSPHCQTWTALTSRRPGGIPTDVPYDLGTLESVLKRVCHASSATPPANDHILPVLD
jgi:hypothetical protein